MVMKHSHYKIYLKNTFLKLSKSFPQTKPASKHDIPVRINKNFWKLLV